MLSLQNLLGQMYGCALRVLQTPINLEITNAGKKHSDSTYWALLPIMRFDEGYEFTEADIFE
ncbi:MAG: hypothetical protein ACK4Q5_04835 [Saprospiraceae bacterium]